MPTAPLLDRIDSAPAIPLAAVWRFSVSQYHQMLAAGILVAELAREQLEAIVPAAWHVQAPHPVTTSDSEPEPDVTVVRGKRRDYKQRHPSGGDIGLVVEVADSSLKLDRTTKLRIYARAKIPAYWIINLIDRQVEAFAKPSGARAKYRECHVFGETDNVPVVLDGREIGRIAVRELLP